MYGSIEAFLGDWKQESANTAKVMRALTDASLPQSVSGGHRTLGRVAWHIATCIPEMMGRTGLVFRTLDEHAPLPESAEAIASAYEGAAAELATLLAAEWTDETLEIEDDMYGGPWSRGLTLAVLLRHEIHHRGQMTVLMRQAGLAVPGTYGPAQEDWEKVGVPEPPV